MKYIKKFKAFTLIEMIIVIAVVVILATISVPLYKDYVWNSKTLEAYSLLAKIREAQIQYYNEYGCFLRFPNSSGGNSCYEEVLDVDARGNKYFTIFTVGGNDSNASFFQADTCCNYGGWKKLYMKYNITGGGSTFWSEGW